MGNPDQIGQGQRRAKGAGGANFQKQGMVGSAKHFLGDDEIEGNKKSEKLKFVNKGENNRNERDKAAVKYNFLDFLS